MWQLYQVQEQGNNRRALGYNVYRKEFNKYSLGFGSYKADTCSTCDKLREQLQADPEDRELKLRRLNT